MAGRSAAEQVKELLCGTSITVTWSTAEARLCWRCSSSASAGITASSPLPLLLLTAADAAA